jgi:beta-N-acetylhexosaminidase
VAHISYPQLDENDIASMSAPIISGLLREELGFSGVVMSDDFRMGGLTGRYDVGEAAVRFINAGGDLILCGAVAESQIAIMQALQAAAADGSLSEARINESLMRILLLKLKSGLWTPS